MSILVLNAGSSSLKFAIFDRTLDLLMKGGISGLDGAPVLGIRHADGAQKRTVLGAEPMGMEAAVSTLFEALDAEDGLLDGIRIVGHRIVHGGQRYREPALLDEEALAYLRTLQAMAPLHQPANLAIIEAAGKRLPRAIHAGCFDTAFHHDRPAVEKLYALPRHLSEDGLVSYGFHGLSYEYVASVLSERYPKLAGGRVIVAHLGSGSSLCAMRQGRSVATTMGFSPLDGLVMSTRCGALDPGIVLHLMNEKRLSGQEIQALLYRKSGLLGVSGLSGDMQLLLSSDEPGARLAVDHYIHAVSRQIGALAASLCGLDTLVFTAGIGENSPAIRERIASSAQWLGVQLEPQLNEARAERIDAEGSRVAILLVATNEELTVARGAASLIVGGGDL